MFTEITVFRPQSRQRDFTLKSMIPAQTVDALAERLGKEAGDKAKSAMRSMDRLGSDLLQIRLDDRRIRIKKPSTV